MITVYTQSRILIPGISGITYDTVSFSKWEGPHCFPGNEIFYL
jgi:hypothetical protein